MNCQRRNRNTDDTDRRMKRIRPNRRKALQCVEQYMIGNMLYLGKPGAVLSGKNLRDQRSYVPTAETLSAIGDYPFYPSIRVIRVPI